VRQLARLSETGKERLARLPRAFLSLGPIRLEQIPAALGKDDRAVVRAECRRAQQTLSFEVTLGSAGVLAAVVEIALGHNPKGADGGEHPALGAVDLVHSVTFSYRTAIAASWEVEVLREDVSRIVLVWAITFAGSARAAATSIAKVNVLAFSRRSRVVSVPHGCSCHQRRDINGVRVIAASSMRANTGAGNRSSGALLPLRVV
jgi:hypothetical protein